MPDALASPQDSRPQSVSALLALPELPTLGAIAVLAAQPFAELATRFTWPAWLPLVVALMTAAMASLAHLWVIRNTADRTLMVVLPLQTIVIFGLAVGANNAIGAWLDTPERTKPNAGTVQSQDRVTELEKRLRELATVLLGSLPPTESPPATPSPAPGAMGPRWFERGFDQALAVFVTEANAQPSKSAASPKPPANGDGTVTLSPDQVKRLREILNAPPATGSKPASGGPRDAPLWRTWGGPRSDT